MSSSLRSTLRCPRFVSRPGLAALSSKLTSDSYKQTQRCTTTVPSNPEQKCFTLRPPASPIHCGCDAHILPLFARHTHTFTRSQAHKRSLSLLLSLTLSYSLLLSLTLSYTLLHSLTLSYTLLHSLTLSYTLLLPLTPSYSLLLPLTPSYSLLLPLTLRFLCHFISLCSSFSFLLCLFLSFSFPLFLSVVVSFFLTFVLGGKRCGHNDEGEILGTDWEEAGCQKDNPYYCLERVRGTLSSNSGSMLSRRVRVCTGTVGRDEPVEGDVVQEREPQCWWRTFTSRKSR